MSKPMIFSEDEAFEQLRDEGVVYTVRNEEKELGDVWIRRSRTGEKEFDAERFFKSTLNEKLLEHFQNQSGFDSVEDWKEAIKGEGKWIYGVKREDVENPLEIEELEEALKKDSYEETVEKEIELPEGVG